MRRQGKKLAQVARIQARGQLHIPNTGSNHDPEAEFDEALEAFGLQEQGADESAMSSHARQSTQDKCYLWPCNVAAFIVWQNLRTQWRLGPDGRVTGLDYAGVSAYLVNTLRVKGSERAALFSSLQAMELSTLAALQQKN